MARTHIIYNSMDFYSMDVPGVSPEELCDEFYSQFQYFNKMKIELENGDFFLIGEDAIKSCVILFEEIENE